MASVRKATGDSARTVAGDSTRKSAGVRTEAEASNSRALWRAADLRRLWRCGGARTMTTKRSECHDRHDHNCNVRVCRGGP